ncbi:MAG: hypothetical protein GY806_02260, partial [Gammaproteobacteria bacterium]|nr:hypothetical protein [Gammaproteobacteria bacterium]
YQGSQSVAGFAGNIGLPDDSTVAFAGFSAESAAFCSVSTPPVSVRQQTAWQPVLELPRRVGIVDLESRVYTNQSEFGEARAAGSNLDGGGNAPFFMR